MNLIQGISIRTTPAPNKVRKVPGYWNWGWLVKLVQQCLDTGKEQQKQVGTHLAIVRPKSPVTTRYAKENPEWLIAHEKVQILLFDMCSTLYAEKGETIPCPHEKDLDNAWIMCDYPG